MVHLWVNNLWFINWFALCFECLSITQRVVHQESQRCDSSHIIAAIETNQFLAFWEVLQDWNTLDDANIGHLLLSLEPYTVDFWCISIDRRLQNINVCEFIARTRISIEPNFAELDSALNRLGLIWQNDLESAEIPKGAVALSVTIKLHVSCDIARKRIYMGEGGPVLSASQLWFGDASEGDWLRFFRCGQS